MCYGICVSLWAWKKIRMESTNVGRRKLLRRTNKFGFHRAVTLAFASNDNCSRTVSSNLHHVFFRGANCVSSDLLHFFISLPLIFICCFSWGGHIRDVGHGFICWGRCGSHFMAATSQWLGRNRSVGAYCKPIYRWVDWGEPHLYGCPKASCDNSFNLRMGSGAFSWRK